MPRAGRAAAALAGEQLQQRSVERQRDPGAVARLAVGAERAAMAERGQPGEGQRQDPVARPAAGVRDEPDAAGVVLEPRVVERASVGVRSRSLVMLSTARLRRGDGTGRRRGESTAAGSGATSDVGRGGSPASHLIGDLAVDGQVEAHLLGLLVDPDAEEQVDDLDDDERGDDGVRDRRADRDELVDELLRVALEQARVGGLDRGEAKMPVATAPNMPPTPWTAKTSSASSTLERARRSVALKHRPPATRPMISAPPTVTKPDAGVIATRPATAPQAAPTTLTLRDAR